MTPEIVSHTVESTIAANSAKGTYAAIVTVFIGEMTANDFVLWGGFAVAVITATVQIFATRKDSKRKSEGDRRAKELDRLTREALLVQETRNAIEHKIRVDFALAKIAALKNTSTNAACPTLNTPPDFVDSEILGITDLK